MGYNLPWCWIWICSMCDSTKSLRKFFKNALIYFLTRGGKILKITSRIWMSTANHFETTRGHMSTNEWINKQTNVRTEIHYKSVSLRSTAVWCAWLIENHQFSGFFFIWGLNMIWYLKSKHKYCFFFLFFCKYYLGKYGIEVFIKLR